MRSFHVSVPVLNQPANFAAIITEERGIDKRKSDRRTEICVTDITRDGESSRRTLDPPRVSRRVLLGSISADRVRRIRRGMPKGMKGGGGGEGDAGGV